MLSGNFKRTVMIMALSAIMTGCATQKNRDPYQSYNKAMFKFNNVAYKYFLTPISDGYNFIVPKEFSHGISNVYSNVKEPYRVLNDLLQGKLVYAAEDTGRFVINSVFGFFGLFDAAKFAYLPSRSYQGFDITMAQWGYRYSPYIVLPFLGPSTVGAAFGYIPQAFLNPLSYTMPAILSSTGTVVSSLNTASIYLPFLEKLIANSVNSYVNVRSSYLQNYDYQVNQIIGKNTSNKLNNEDQQVLDILNQQ